MAGGTTYALLRWFFTSSTKTCSSPFPNLSLPSTVDFQRRLSSTISIFLSTTLPSLHCLWLLERSFSKMFTIYDQLRSSLKVKNTQWPKLSNLMSFRLHTTAIFPNNMRPINIFTGFSLKFTSLVSRTAYSTIQTSFFGSSKELFKPLLFLCFLCISSVQPLSTLRDIRMISGYVA